MRAAVLSLVLAVAACSSTRAPGSESAGASAPPAEGSGVCSAEGAVGVGKNSDGSPRTLPYGQPDRPTAAIVLHYADLGPQAMAHELLGPSTYSWLSGACFAPDDSFDVRIVIYRGMTLADVRAAYPVVRNRADYRYVEYRAVLAYLDEQLDALKADDDAPLRALAARLRATRSRIVSALGPA